MTTTATTAADTALDPRRRLGVISIAFMIIAASAPLTVVAGGVPTSFAVTGLEAIPAGYVVLALIFALFAIGYAAMARHIERAGAFYAYIAQGLGRPLGIGSALGALVAYNMMQIGIFAMFGFTVSDWLNTRFGIATPCWAWVLAGIVAIGALGMNRIDLSAKVIGTLVALEFLVVAVVDVIGLAVAPEDIDPTPLNPAELFVPGVGAILAFGVAAFMGFESAAIYSREARDPRRTIGRATMLAVLVIGVFYAFSSWALAVGVGTSQVVAQSQELGPALMFVFLEQHGGAFVTDIANVLFITSLFAALLSFHNAVARYFAELGAEEVLPAWFGRRSRAGAPITGSISQSVIALLVTLGFVIADSGDPLFPVLTMFTWLTNSGAFGLIMLMVFVAAAVIGFFRRDPRDAGIVVRLIAPAISGLALLAVLLLVLANFNTLLGQETVTPLTFLLPAIVIVPGVLGVLWGLVLRRRDPAKYERVGHHIVEIEHVR